LWMAQIRAKLQREKFIKSIRVDNQQIKNNRVAVPVGNEEIDDIVLEPPELDVNNIDNESDNEDNEDIDDFIKLWFEGLDEEDISEDNISDNEIDNNLNELLNIQIHSADNDNAK
ncbi:25669_t:CDS:1, partial [Gigaspora margarita]